MLHRLEGESAATRHPFVDVFRPWQEGPVSWMVAENITTGTSPTTFSPKDAVTRGQLSNFFYRYKGEPAVTVSWASPPCTG